MLTSVKGKPQIVDFRHSKRAKTVDSRTSSDIALLTAINVLLIVSVWLIRSETQEKV